MHLVFLGLPRPISFHKYASFLIFVLYRKTYLILVDILFNRFVDWATGENFNAKVVFRLYIKPDSYHVGPQTIGATEEIDLRISNQEIEWSTKQRGAIVFYGLLLKLDKTC